MAGDFWENEDGVHFFACGEHAVCGDALDIGSEGDVSDMARTTKRVVTCPSCVHIIRSCQGVKTRLAR